MNTIFEQERFEAFCERFPPAFKVRLLEFATVAGGTVSIPSHEVKIALSMFAPLRRPRSPFGLGDVVASIAQPTARIIDGILGTTLVNCGGCAKRHEDLNRMMPDIRNPLG